MALWGNNDNKFSGGTVSLNYGTRTVTGTGTTFGETGAAQVGDVIRFGTNAFGGSTGFMGDAVIVSVASTISLKIDSTAGLSQSEITDTQFEISESPKYLPTDSAHNQNYGSPFHDPDRLKLSTTTAARVAVGATIVFVNDNPITANLAAGDLLAWGPHIIGQRGNVFAGTSTSILLNTGVVSSIYEYHAVRGENYAVGSGTVKVTERTRSGDFHSLFEIKVGDTFKSGSNSIGIGTITFNFPGQRLLTLDTPLTQEVAGGAEVDIERGLESGASVNLFGAETLNRKESAVAGLGAAESDSAATTKFALTSAGWVGITTYLDNAGELRVKTETFVAMSGIQTGNTDPYPPFAS
jgi:hypothetical protein